MKQFSMLPHALPPAVAQLCLVRWQFPLHLEHGSPLSRSRLLLLRLRGGSGSLFVSQLAHRRGGTRLGCLLRYISPPYFLQFAAFARGWASSRSSSRVCLSVSWVFCSD